ncbi:MAG: cache domain-containing protein [Nitrospirae bacterium]|nr:cache domain-containing protein [Nitrospirota bacterium]
MMTKYTRYAVACLIIFAVLFSCNYAGAETSDGTPLGLIKAKEGIASAFSELNAHVSRAASDLSKTGLNGPGARKVLQDLCESESFIIDCSTVDLKGTMIAVEPADYKQHEGADIGTQEHVITLHKTKKPVFSNVFRAVEGFYAVDLEHPVFFAKRMIGSVSVLFRPETLLAGIIRPLAQDRSLEFMVIQKDSRILYDTDRERTGRMIFTDPIYRRYPDLLSLANRMAKEKSGTGSYLLPVKGMDKPARKKVSWITVNLFAAEWRIAVSQPVSTVQSDLS